MKKYFEIYYFAIVAAIVTSCGDLLDTKPEESISDEGIIVSQSSAEVALVGVYDAVSSAEGTGIVAWNVAADNVVGFTSQSVIIPRLKAAGSGAFDPTSGGGYVQYYSAINSANAVIYYVKGIDDSKFTDNSKNKILGEAYFLRALSYLDLARTYGGVPIVLNPSVSSTSQDGIRKSSREDVFKQVGNDLDVAESLLANVPLSGTGRARASIWAVYALKARLYLYTEKWDNAEEYASKIIDNTSIKLTTEVEDFFKNPLSSESIFELVFSSADKNSFYTYYLPSDKGGRLDYIPNPELTDKLTNPVIGGKRSQLIIARNGGGYAIREYDKQDGSSSIFVLRLAEQYLIRAEARLKKASANISGAVADINSIRSRADIELLSVSAELNNNDLLLLIEDERRYELAFEGHRYYDIIRTKRAPSVFGTSNPGYNEDYRDEKYWVFPFPYTALTADPDLEQNPGYN
jgi:hypothetical protein